AFLEHFSNLQSLDWADTDAVASFMVTSERLSTGSAYPFDEAAARARVLQILQRTQSPASMFNHATIDVRNDWTGRFREISVPVLVVHGEQDPILPVENGRALAEGIKAAQFFEMPAVGHEIPEPLIEEISGRIASFLGQ
ncbi:MAG: alpha/beta fold hydrolase, partial [Phyllobacteriaceae bacterium]|nr:alpha/beta fold hydrolase [Phyllobacteriaceae bacterium]